MGDNTTPATRLLEELTNTPSPLSSTSYFTHGQEHFISYTDPNLDIALGIVYLLLALFGIWSNSFVIWHYIVAMKTLKLLPFLFCAVVLACNDLVMCTLDSLPYSILMIMGRPDEVNAFACKIFGFVNNFSNKFAWLVITSLILFRCISLVFPIKLRNVDHTPFVWVLSFVAFFLISLTSLPFFQLSFITSDYKYEPNYGECMYGFNTTKTPEMVPLMSTLWWGPFIVSVVSTTVFVISLSAHKSRAAGGGSRSRSDAGRKTILLTVFFIVCYAPKSGWLILIYALNKGTVISWESVLKIPYGVRLMTYSYSIINFVIPTARAAFTPQMLRLRKYIEVCTKRKRSNDNTTRAKTSIFKIGITRIKSVGKIGLQNGNDKSKTKSRLDSPKINKKGGLLRTCEEEKLMKLPC